MLALDNKIESDDTFNKHLNKYDVIYLNMQQFLIRAEQGKPAIIVELKYDKSAVTALQQIKDRKYTQALERYSGEIVLVGADYDRDNADKPHSCLIERM